MSGPNHAATSFCDIAGSLASESSFDFLIRNMQHSNWRCRRAALTNVSRPRSTQGQKHRMKTPISRRFAFALVLVLVTTSATAQTCEPIVQAVMDDARTEVAMHSASGQLKVGRLDRRRGVYRQGRRFRHPHLVRARLSPLKRDTRSYADCGHAWQQWRLSQSLHIDIQLNSRPPFLSESHGSQPSG
jgi:hypothetical protein